MYLNLNRLKACGSLVGGRTGRDAAAVLGSSKGMRKVYYDKWCGSTRNTPLERNIQDYLEILLLVG